MRLRKRRRITSFKLIKKTFIHRFTTLPCLVLPILREDIFCHCLDHPCHRNRTICLSPSSVSHRDHLGKVKGKSKTNSFGNVSNRDKRDRKRGYLVCVPPSSTLP